MNSLLALVSYAYLNPVAYLARHQTSLKQELT